MKQILKQVAGIDVSQKELVVSLGRMYHDLETEVYAFKVFSNTARGFLTLTAWIKKLTDQGLGIRIVMEATGVYHEALAYYLDDKGLAVSVVLPNKISNYFRTLEIKTVTDKTASEVIAQFGLERNLDNWKRPKEIYKRLRQITRERDQIVAERTTVKNQLHAENAEAEPNKTSIIRIKKRIQLLNAQEKEIQAEIAQLVRQDDEASKKIAIIKTLPGVGLLTAAIVLAETNGFELIRNKKQLTSYAGLDVREKQSGTSVKGKPRISKKGNKHLRKAMHLPALAAIRCDERYKTIFTRLVSKHGIKMKATVAIQRKLLELIFTLFKSTQPYDKNYLAKYDNTPTNLLVQPN
jgi:transposase